MRRRLLGVAVAVAVAATVVSGVAPGSRSAPGTGARPSQAARSPGAVWVGSGSDAGGRPVYQLFRSSDGGEHWASVYRIQTAPDCNAGWKLAVRGQTAYVGTSCPRGVFRTTDGGKSWKRRSSGLPRGSGVSAIAIDPRTPRVAYASVFSWRNGRSLGFFRSRDVGEHWQRVDRSLGYYLRGRWTRPRGWPPVQVSGILINPREPNVIYGEGNPCVKSTDGGRSWTILQLDAPGRFLPCPSLAMDPRHPQVLYAGSEYSKRNPWYRRLGLNKTTDGGRTWVTMQNGLPSGFEVQKLAVDARNPALVYAALTLFSGGGRVYRSKNGGRTWVGTSLQLRGRGFQSQGWRELVVDPAAGGTAYAAGWSGGGGQETGVLKTANGGASWTPKNEGLPRDVKPYTRTWGSSSNARDASGWYFSGLGFQRDVVGRGPLLVESFQDTFDCMGTPDPVYGNTHLTLSGGGVAIDVAANGTFSYAGGVRIVYPKPGLGDREVRGKLTLSGRIAAGEIRGTFRITGPSGGNGDCPSQVDSGARSFVAACRDNCGPPPTQPLARLDALAVG